MRVQVQGVPQRPTHCSTLGQGAALPGGDAGIEVPKLNTRLTSQGTAGKRSFERPLSGKLPAIDERLVLAGSGQLLSTLQRHSSYYEAAAQNRRSGHKSWSQAR